MKNTKECKSESIFYASKMSSMHLLAFSLPTSMIHITYDHHSLFMVDGKRNEAFVKLTEQRSE